MKKTLLTLIILVFSLVTFAQYPIGHRSLTYQDAARANRNIPVEIYYPAVSAGDNVSVAAGQFPIIAFGHGFLMGYDSYAYWKDQLVPLGYIIVFPTTEGGTPDHAAFGADLAFLINYLKSESSNTGSPFFQHINSESAIMGHSMGGGASFLACENNMIPDCMITFAAATTNPSSINAAAHVTIPALVISGEDDCVAPPADNQQAMYDSLGSDCKVFIGIKNGAHCYFADYNFSCTLGESFCNPTPSIVREDQLATTLTFTRYYLDYYLKGLGSWAAFQDSLSSDADINYQMSCPPPIGIKEPQILQSMKLSPNPASNEVLLQLTANIQQEVSLRVLNLYGQTVLYKELELQQGEQSVTIDCSSLSRGSYYVVVNGSDHAVLRSLLILQ